MTRARKATAKSDYLAHLLLAAWTPLQDLNFVAAHRCETLRRLADDAKSGRTVSAQEVAAIGELIKARAGEALKALFAAYAHAIDVELEADQKEAA